MSAQSTPKTASRAPAASSSRKSSRETNPRQYAPRPPASTKPREKKPDTLLRKATSRGRTRKVDVSTEDSDSRPRKLRRVEIEIPIHVHKKYRPELIPPSGPITLAPVKDSTAYIVDKIVWPLKHETVETSQRKLYYIIGWRDLPAARISVLACDVLDYVDPWEFEDWNYRDLLRREEEKEKERKAAEEEKKKAKATGAAKIPGRRGRLPKRRLEEIPPTPELSEQDQALIAAKKATGLSLSIPQKSGLGRFLEEETGVEETGAEETGAEQELYLDQEPDDIAIRRQLLENAAAPPGQDSEGDQLDFDDPMDLDELAEPVSGRSRSRGMVDAGPSSSTASVPTGQHPAYAASLASASNSPAGKLPDKAPAVSIKKTTKTTASIIRKSSVPLAGWESSASSLSGHSPPPPARVHPMYAKAMRMQQPGHGTLHQAPPPTQHATQASKRVSQVPIPSYTLPSQKNQSSLRSFGFTPVASSLKNSMQATAFSSKPLPSANDDILGEAEVTPVRSKKAKGKEKEKKKEKKPRSSKKNNKEQEYDFIEDVVEAAAEEDVWEVKKLLADKYDYDDGGNLTHKYQVLWEGDWPAWQNPSWEPAENIAPELVAEYHRAQAKKGKNTAKPPAHLPRKRYSNVAEAFEDGLIEEPQPRSDLGICGDDGEDKLFVEEEEERAAKIGGKKVSGEKDVGGNTEFGVWSSDSQMKAYQTLYGLRRVG